MGQETGANVEGIRVWSRKARPTREGIGEERGREREEAQRDSGLRGRLSGALHSTSNDPAHIATAPDPTCCCKRRHNTNPTGSSASRTDLYWRRQSINQCMMQLPSDDLLKEW